MIQASPRFPGQFLLEIPPAGGADAPTASRRGLKRLGMASAALFLALLVHALLVRPDTPDSLDARVMIQVQRIDLPGLGRWLNEFERLTDSGGAVAAWLVTLLVFAALRWWLPAMAVLSLPLGGVINETVSRVLVTRTRPHLDVLRHRSENFEDRSFPSGHVVGAVLLYGLIWYVVARRVRFAPLRWLVQLACGVVVVLTGFDRVWDGAHWPTDVIAGYALGLALLIGLILVCEWIEREGVWIAFAPDGPRPIGDRGMWRVSWGRGGHGGPPVRIGRSPTMAERGNASLVPPGADDAGRDGAAARKWQPASENDPRKSPEESGRAAR